MIKNWLVIGVSGVTCGGKTTLATELNNLFPNSRVISQDDYFLDVNDPRHTWVPELSHIHFDILTSLDMDKMFEDIENLISNNGTKKANSFQKISNIPLEEYTKSDLQKMINLKLKQSDTNLLIIEGFCIFNYRPIEYLCDLKYFFKLDREECFVRRNQRVYEPPDCSGYFEICVWPEYLKQLEDVKKNVNDITYFHNTLEPTLEVLLDMLKVL